MDQRRRTTVNCRSSVESTKMTSKLEGDVTSGLTCPISAYETGGVRHRGSVSLVWAPMLNCGNLRWRLKGKAQAQIARLTILRRHQGAERPVVVMRAR